MAIFQRLANGPIAVNELASTLPVTRPAVSQHLRVLKDAGLVFDSKAGTRRLYQLNPEGVVRLRAHFDQMWAQAMSAFQQAAEKSPTGEKHGTHSRGGRRPQKRPRTSAH
jgi:biotin operon repressor